MLATLLRQEIIGDGLISLIGVAAATLTTSSFVPQLIKAYRTKKMDDVSPYLMAIFMTGTILWTLYGFYRSDLVIVGANAVATGLNVALLYLKHAYRRRPAKQT